MTQFLDLSWKGENQWWRYLLTVLVIVGFSQWIGILPSMLYVETAVQGDLSLEEFEYYKTDLDFEALGLSSNIGLVLLISSFAIGILGLYLSIKYIHQRPFRSLFNNLNAIRWNRIWFSILVWGGFSILLFLLNVLIYDDNYYFQLDWKHFLPLLIIVFILLPFQTSFEELVYRAYLPQSISIFTKRAIVPLLISAVLFGIAHMFNPEVEAFGWEVMFLYYFGFGLTLGIITVIDNGLEIALGMHAIHNIFSALTVTYDDAVIQTDAIWSSDTVTFDWLALGIMYVFFALFIWLVYKKYGVSSHINTQRIDT